MQLVVKFGIVDISLKDNLLTALLHARIFDYNLHTEIRIHVGGETGR